MASVLHGSARTTPRIRAEFQASKESSRALATAYGLNPKAVAKWRGRADTADALQASRRRRGGKSAPNPETKAAPPDAGGPDPEEPRDARLFAPPTDKEPGPNPVASEARASTTDAEARVMKMADGGFRPAFNVQFATDTQSDAVAGLSVDNSGSDMGKMAPMSDAIAAAYGTRPGEHLAGGGYAKLADLERLTTAGVIAFVPLPKPGDPARDRFAPRADNTEALAAWRARMSTDAAKAIYKQRSATTERVNAQARNTGLMRFIVRGIDKPRAVACWHGLANNMAWTSRFAAV